MSENIKSAKTMPVLALRGLVIFPKMVLHFDVGREKSVLALNEVMSKNRQLFLVAQKDIRNDDPDSKELYKVGVVAEVRQIIKTQGNTLRVLVDGKYRAKLVKITNEEPFLEAEIIEHPLTKSRISRTALCDALMRTVKDLFEEYCYLMPKMPKDMMANVMLTEDPVYLAEFIAGNIPFSLEIKQSILEENSPVKRLEILAKALENENEILSLENDIHERVREQIDRGQREYYLREQLKAISMELGDEDSPAGEVDTYKRKIEAMKLDKESTEKLNKEADRLLKMPSNSHEAAVIRGYLDTVTDLPWNKSTKDKIDLAKATKILDKDHYGLEKVKERILEILAVRKLAPDVKGQIICLAGPPGVGKTSIANSIARSMGRKYARVSLGGVRDESDIRGHRKTYIGSMPGRIITAVKQAGSSNPLILLDEIDKLGNDFKGDPASALLEVLDAEQNSAFRDHYIEVPFDLSDVLFIATANNLERVPAPLYDRMEIIELTSYTSEEKFQIAKKHLLQKQLKKHGLRASQIKISDNAIREVIDSYTKEAGVRTLERRIAALCRKSAKLIVDNPKQKVVITPENLEEFLGPKKYRDDALPKKDSVGLANGLAWTSVGGEMLQVEVAVMDGTGKQTFTGSLGDVMKESVTAAITYIRSNYSHLGIPQDFYKEKDIHIHFPEGAVPKDGPSAGITTCTAIVSALTGIPVMHDVAMTGEITLRGRVLPIGGLKEKTMAAYKHGIKTVIIPEANVSDLAEIEPVVRENIEFIPASEIDTVLKTALASYPPRHITQAAFAVSKKDLAAEVFPQ